jgi:hypothetical protein
MRWISFKRKSFRRSRGATLSEFGPALFLIFFFAIFPVLDMIALGFAYISTLSLNDLQLREAVRVPRSQAIDPNGPVMSGVTKKYLSTVMGGLIGSVKPPLTSVDYVPSDVGINVVVTTTSEVNPFLAIPFFPNVPGLSSPATFSVQASRLIESPSYAGQ